MHLTGAGARSVTTLVNGKEYSATVGTTVQAVVDELALGRSGIAVALNGEVVSKSRWTDTFVGEGDRLEVLTAAQGG